MGFEGQPRFQSLHPKGSKGRLVGRSKAHGNEVGVTSSWPWSFRLLHAHFRKKKIALFRRGTEPFWESKASDVASLRSTNDWTGDFLVCQEPISWGMQLPY